MTDSISVEGLVKIAEELTYSGHHRAAIMEAMTALEERVNEVVFERLETRKGLPSGLVTWLRDKTKYSFDEKLHPIGEFALGKPISKGEKLWNDYKKARDYRNKVSHTAKNVSGENARFVIQTVREWLYFLQEAQELQGDSEPSDLTMEFLSLYAILSSRFRFSGTSKSIPIASAAMNARRKGQLSEEDERLIRAVTAHRNKVAHGIQTSPSAMQDLIPKLKALIKRLQGVELDGAPTE